MQRVRLVVLRSGRFAPDEGFHVYGDGGTGIMDWAHPVTPRRILFWDDLVPQAGHLLGGHMTGRHVGGVPRDGHLEGTHLYDGHLEPALAIFFETEPHVFGRFRHAVVTEDAAGNAQTAGATVYERVIHAEPLPARDLRPTAFDEGSGRLTFAFTPSDRLIG